MKLLAWTLTLLVPSTLGWAPQIHGKPKTLIARQEPLPKSELSSTPNDEKKDDAGILLAGASLLAVPALLFPESAQAAVAGAPNAIPSALAAYGHYFSLLGCMICICYERFTIKPNMSDDEENGIAIADTAFGVFGLLLTYSGYLRLTEYEKGWSFYSHEPWFWVKIGLVGVWGASSFFNTTKIIQRAVAKQTGGDFQPMNEKLAARMTQICNAELTALAFIPLTAALVARGVGYSNTIPWQAGAGIDLLVFGGLSFKYIKEALDFVDGPIEDESTEIMAP